MNTRNFAFISRHSMTSEQLALAALAGIILHHVGDMDGDTVFWDDVEDVFHEKTGLDTDKLIGAVMVHVGAGIRLATQDDRPVGWFSNANRAPEGAPPSFKATALNFANWDLDHITFPRFELPE